MSINIIKTGKIECDTCKKTIAEIKTTEKVFRSLEQEAEATKIICAQCSTQ